MTSKELFSEILEEDIVWYEIKDNVLEYNCFASNINKNINIYELAHKCKELAFKKYNITLRYLKIGLQSGSSKISQEIFNRPLNKDLFIKKIKVCLNYLLH